jgi:hypothetical protein
MPNIEVPDFSQALTANGDATGYAIVTDSSGFYVGCIAYLSRTTGVGKRCIITEIKDATHVGIRFIADDNEQQGPVQMYGGRSNLTGFTTALTSTLWMESQLARIDPALVKPTKRNV